MGKKLSQLAAPASLSPQVQRVLALLETLGKW
jgi:hypothetical protein